VRCGWFSTVDHKEIGRRYLVTAMAFLIIGGIEALIIRPRRTRLSVTRRATDGFLRAGADLSDDFDDFFVLFNPDLHSRRLFKRLKIIVAS
jgi:heme/copper-type cytochrome/quinol oxidase subunit 1